MKHIQAAPMASVLMDQLSGLIRHYAGCDISTCPICIKFKAVEAVLMSPFISDQPKWYKEKHPYLADRARSKKV